MEPVVSPWMLYVISISGTLCIMFGVLGAVLLLVGLAFFLVRCVLLEELNDISNKLRFFKKKELDDGFKSVLQDTENKVDDVSKTLKKNMEIKCLIFAVPCFILSAALPSQQQGAQMLAASLFTRDKLEYMRTEGATSDDAQNIQDIFDTIAKAAKSIETHR